jgi:hypothetical protein
LILQKYFVLAGEEEAEFSLDKPGGWLIFLTKGEGYILFEIAEIS